VEPAFGGPRSGLVSDGEPISRHREPRSGDHRPKSRGAEIATWREAPERRVTCKDYIARDFARSSQAQLLDRQAAEIAALGEAGTRNSPRLDKYRVRVNPIVKRNHVGQIYRHPIRYHRHNFMLEINFDYHLL
jgi:hypothetical protein